MTPRQRHASWKEIQFLSEYVEGNQHTLPESHLKKAEQLWTHTDGSYVMTEATIEESDRVKKFDRFISDIKIVSESRKSK